MTLVFIIRTYFPSKVKLLLGHYKYNEFKNKKARHLTNQKMMSQFIFNNNVCMFKFWRPQRGRVGATLLLEKVMRKMHRNNLRRTWGLHHSIHKESFLLVGLAAPRSSYLPFLGLAFEVLQIASAPRSTYLPFVLKPKV